MSNAEQLDRAAGLMRQLESLKTERPVVPSVWDRALARCVDLGFAIIVGMIVGGVAWLLQVLIWGGKDLDGRPPEPSTGEDVFYAVVLMVWLAFLVWNEVVGVGRGRQTVGKRFQGIQVVVAEGEAAPSPLRMLGRATTEAAVSALTVGVWTLIATRVSSGAAFVVMLAFLAILAAEFVGRDGRALHDWVAGTRLVRPS